MMLAQKTNANIARTLILQIWLNPLLALELGGSSLTFTFSPSHRETCVPRQFRLAATGARLNSPGDSIGSSAFPRCVGIYWRCYAGGSRLRLCPLLNRQVSLD